MKYARDREPEQHLRPLRHPFVGERVHERSRAGDLPVHRGELVGVVAAQAAVRLVGGGGRGLGLERRITGAARRGLGLVGERLGAGVIAVHGALADQHERQGGRQAGLAVAQRGALGLQQPARLVRVVGPQRLQLAEHHGHRDPLGGRLGREHGEHPAQHVACLRRAPGRHQRQSLGPQQPDTTLLMLRRIGQ